MAHAPLPCEANRNQRCSVFAGDIGTHRTRREDHAPHSWRTENVPTGWMVIPSPQPEVVVDCTPTDPAVCVELRAILRRQRVSKR